MGGIYVRSQSLESKPISRAVLDFLCGFSCFCDREGDFPLHTPASGHPTLCGFRVSGLLLRRVLLRQINIDGPCSGSFLLALGGFLPAIAINRLGMAWTAPPFLLFYLLASSFGIAIGFTVGSLATRRRMPYAVGLGLIAAGGRSSLSSKQSRSGWIVRPTKP